MHSGTELRRWYRLGTELAAMAGAHGVSTGGGKRSLTDRLAVGHPRRAALQPGAAGVARHPGWPGFHFDEPMRRFVADGAGRPLADAVAHWYATRGQAPAPIAPQLELNAFLRARRLSHPTGPRAEALEAWRVHRSLPVEART